MRLSGLVHLRFAFVQVQSADLCCFSMITLWFNSAWIESANVSTVLTEAVGASYRSMLTYNSSDG